MLQMVRLATMVVAAALCLGCDRVDFKGLIAPTGDVVNRRFDISLSLTEDKSVASIATRERYTLYVCADPHISTSTDNLQQFVTRLDADNDASFGIVLGDCTDQRGAMSEYANTLRGYKPIFSLLGNHDLYFSGWDDYRELIGPSVYWFEVAYNTGRDLFIAIDSASGTLGSKQIEWLRKLLTTSRRAYRHCIILTHTNLFYTDNSQTGAGSLPMEETMTLVEMFSHNNVTLCLQGHDHYREDLNVGSVRYTIVGTIRDEAKEPEYLLITLSDSGIEYEWQYL